MADLESNHLLKKRRKLDDDHKKMRTWRTQREQQIYSEKLLEALRRIRRGTTTTVKTSRGREIRETADRILATSAKGTTRWSRAILANRIGRLRPRKRRRARVSGECWLKRKEELAGVNRKFLAGTERKVKVLGRLVPGCRKLSLRSLIYEASDYIAALEMQVRAMTTLAHTLSSGEPLNADG